VVILDKGRVVLAGQLSELRAAAPRRRLGGTLASDAGDRWWERWSPALSTVVLVACAVAGIAIPAALLGHPQRFTIAVTEQAPPGLAAMARADAKAAGLQLTVRPVASRAAAVRLVEQGQAAAAVAAGGETIWKTHASSGLQPALNAVIQQATITQRAASLGLSPGDAARLLSPVRITVTQLHADTQRTGRIIVGEVGMILLYMAITIYGSFVLTGVVEEKSSRVVEVLLSRVQPSSLLGGKIAGIGLAGLAQFIAVGAAAVGTLLITRPSGLPPGTYAAIPMLVVWFVLGYAFYSMLYGSLGSLASRTEDAQAAAGPVILVLVAIYVAATMAVSSAGSAWVAVLSLLPPSAPVFMPLRTSLTDVPAWQVAAAMVLTLASVYGLFRIGGRLYRNAVLRTGARVHITEAWHAGLPARP
jgi:ABC-2 type transport system permease protein